MPDPISATTTLCYQSSDDFFKALERCTRLNDAESMPRPGMVYFIGKALRPMRFVVELADTSKDPVRLEGGTPVRGQVPLFRRLLDTIAAIFGRSRDANLRPSQSCASAYRTWLIGRQDYEEWNFRNLCNRATSLKELTEKLPDASELASEHRAALLDMKQAVDADLGPAVRDAMSAIRALFGALPDAAEVGAEAERILQPIRSKLEQRLQACASAGLAANEVKVIATRFNIDGQLKQWHAIASTHGDLASRKDAMIANALSTMSTCGPFCRDASNKPPGE